MDVYISGPGACSFYCTVKEFMLAVNGVNSDAPENQRNLVFLDDSAEEPSGGAQVCDLEFESPPIDWNVFLWEERTPEKPPLNIVYQTLNAIFKEPPRMEGLDLQEQRLIDIFQALSPEKRSEFMTMAENFAAAAHAPPQPEEKALSALPELPGFRPPPKTQEELKAYGIPLYVKRTDAYEHLKAHYGPWLKHFTPELEHDHLYQYQLAKIDPALVKSINNQITRSARPELIGKKLSDIISGKKHAVNDELEELKEQSPKFVENSSRIAQAARRRSHLVSNCPNASL
ncbi:hypothetical protein [Methylomagnum ishizawai]|uniref:hypothetical protein n=1 Tax=Methylomagnum ishizawai TaxID=1760988 RepID=UPI001C33A610|nr:hypothetical protein [Methylomagnum ishizawai]BBL77559.1 hypothetical protein MishRS11D_46570 [Methylomagnum ishizawai]